MRKALFFCMLLFLMSCEFLHEKNVITGTSDVFEIDQIKTLGGSLNDSFQSIAKANDGGYVVLGYTQSDDFDIINKNDTSFDFWVCRFDTNHNLQWSKTYGGSLDDRGADIVATNDGGFALLGYNGSSDGDATQNAGIRDFWMIKIDGSGAISWQKSLGFSGSDYGVSLISTSNNGFLLTGVLDVTASGGQGNSKPSSKHAGGDYWAIKLASDGKTEWTRYFGGSFTDAPFGVVETDSNDFIIAGSSDSDDVDITGNRGTYDFWVIRIDSSGSLLWEKSFGGTQIDEARGITMTSDGNFLIIGDSRSSDLDVSANNGIADLWMVKIDVSGNLLWDKSIGGTNFDAGRSGNTDLQDGFILSGSSRSDFNQHQNKGQNDAWVFGTDSNASLKWQHLVGGSEIDVFYDAIQLNENYVIAVGDTRSTDNDIQNNKGFSDGLIVTLKKR